MAAAGLATGALPAPAQTQTPPAAVPAATGPELRLGALFPLSGPLALLGDESFRGLEIAAEERNVAGGLLGRPIRLLRADVTEPAQAQAEARRMAALAGAERPAALFGTLDSQLALAASQAAELAGMPYVELVAPADALTERGFRLLFRTCPRASELAHTALEAIPAIAALLDPGAASPPPPRIAVLHEDAPGPQALGTTLEQRLRDSGAPLALRTGYQPQPPAEIAAAVRRLRAADPQVLLHCGRGTDATMLFRALREEGWRPRAVIGLGGGYPLAETAQAIGPEFDMTLLADLPQPRIEERFAPGVAAFAEAYRRRYGAEMRSGHSLACYAGAQVAFDALQRAGSATDAARLRAAMLAADVPAGALPNGWGARFDERGQNARGRTVLMQWRDGRLQAVMPAEAALAPMVLRGG